MEAEVEVEVVRMCDLVGRGREGGWRWCIVEERGGGEVGGVGLSWSWLRHGGIGGGVCDGELL